MKHHLALASVLAALALAPVAAVAQTSGGGPQTGTTGGASAGSGQSNPGPSAGDMQRTNPPTSSNAPQNLSGGQQGSNTGATVERVPQGATTGDRPGPEVPRSDSRR
ncbi:MAG TPA: hypothetical protein VGD36_15580 [Xanthobacteraceae bacterium]|jgi:hypothetical protein